MSSQDALEPIWIDLARLAVAAFLGHEDEASVGEALEAAGVTPETTDELIAFVPLAVGRLALARMGVAAPATYVVQDGDRHPHPLAAEPVYRAAQIAARELDGETFERLAPWSAELRVVNDLRARGATDPRLVEPALYLPRRVDDREPPTWTREPTDFYGLGQLLAETCRAHGVAAHTDCTRAITERGETWEGRVFPKVLRPGRALVQVDFAVRSERWPHRELLECFGGFGPDLRSAIGDALQKMLRGTLHVVLDALGGAGCCSDQAQQETWGAWRSVGGPALLLGPQAPGVDLGALGALVRDRVVAADLRREPHWIRVFCAQQGGQRSCSEGLLDNEPWPELQAALAGWPMPPSAEYYAVRWFVIVLPG